MLTIVTGAPCSGKSTYVREHATSGAIVIDLDRIALALTTDDVEHHSYGQHVRSVAIAARAAAIGKALGMAAAGHEVWVIHGKPGRSEYGIYRGQGARFVKCDAPLQVLLQRAAAERPAWVSRTIAEWSATTASQW